MQRKCLVPRLSEAPFLEILMEILIQFDFSNDKTKQKQLEEEPSELQHPAAKKGEDLEII